MLGVTAQRTSQLTVPLVSAKLARRIHMGGKERLGLTDWGIAVLARRDRTSVGGLRNQWSVEPKDERAPITWQNVSGRRSRLLARNMEHTDAVHGFLAQLSRQAKDSRYRVVMLEPLHRASRFFEHNYKMRSIHPDAFGIIRRRNKTLPFFPEWERRAVRPGTMAERLAPYLRYYSTHNPTDDHGAYPVVLIVFDDVRVEDAFPGIVSKSQFRRVAELLRSRAPSRVHPRRVASSYMLSGLVKCKSCRRALSGQDAKSGRFSYYVCQSIMKRSKGACKMPRLNARRFEKLVVGQIRSNILTEGNIRDLVRLVDEEMDGVAHEQRKRLESIEGELVEVRKWLDRLYRAIETSDLDITDIAPRIKENRERERRLQDAAREAEARLSERRVQLDEVETITAFARDMSEYLTESELTERRAFIESFVEEIIVGPGEAKVRYTIPMPQDSRIAGMDAEEMSIPRPVLSTVNHGGAGGTRTPYLFNAIEALSQMSYSPTQAAAWGMPPRFQW